MKQQELHETWRKEGSGSERAFSVTGELGKQQFSREKSLGKGAKPGESEDRRKDRTEPATGIYRQFTVPVRGGHGVKTRNIV